MIIPEWLFICDPYREKSGGMLERGTAARRILMGAKESEQKEPLRLLLQALGRATPRKSNSHQNGNVCLSRFQTTCFPGRQPPFLTSWIVRKLLSSPPGPATADQHSRWEIQAGEGPARISCVFCVILVSPNLEAGFAP